jgi:hypothetical protein
MKFKSRLDRLSKGIAEIKGSKEGLRILFKNSNETTEECLARNAIKDSSEGFNVIICKWAEGEPDYPINQPAAAEGLPTGDKPQSVESDIDREISDLKKELISEGISEAELAEISADEPLGPKPMRSELVSLMKK